MPTTPPDAVADMFDLPPLPPSQQSDADALAAAEAELAAEFAAAIESGEVADDAPDSRAGHRIDVSWPARMRLPDGRVLSLMLRNVSETGVGLRSAEPVPAYTVVDFEMDVPPRDAGGSVACVKGTIKTTYVVAHGSEIHCGGTWQAPPAGLEFVRRWIRGEG